MINGCLDWQKRGLAPPAAVLDATEAYLDEEDAIGAWISERCEVRPDVWDKSEELYKSWRGWAEANNEPAGTQKSLTQALDRRPGLERLRKNKGRGIRGLRVLGDP
jgi:putative DNA primase/helicase